MISSAIMTTKNKRKGTKNFSSLFFKKGIDNTAPMWYIIITKGR